MLIIQRIIWNNFMRREYLISFYAVIAAVGIVVSIFAFPPIIPREGGSSGRSAKAASEKELALKAEENAYCQSNLEDVNCACFARKSGHILAQPQPEIAGYTYADRSELARGRAKQRC